MADSPPTSARDRILETACRLFYRDGLRATGIDRIIAESGVAKMSFYRSFPSKTDLIAAFLRRRHTAWMERFRAGVEAGLTQPGAGLAVIADVLEAWFREPDFRGCAFINTLAESGPSGGEEVLIAREHKAELEAYVVEVARRLGLEHPETVAATAMLIIEGAIVRAQMTGDPGVAALCSALLAGLGRRGRARR
ncbi:MAG TPA: TetR/AcrR family transcriptional regulator [Thiobacillaceae bacterium]|nr:TetR/AcrR family transcriptional regulator [Thiobacillaceae bacterium]HNH89673.1 TetR/AcrR family transcriptional regulator [Thiobacillaceae bacterium]